MGSNGCSSPKKAAAAAAPTLQQLSSSAFSAASSPAVTPLLTQLDGALKQELKFHSSAQPARSETGLITSGMRDGSAHVLRCLKVWYDLPSDVFFSALLSIDRFLEKMKVKKKKLIRIIVA